MEKIQYTIGSRGLLLIPVLRNFFPARMTRLGKLMLLCMLLQPGILFSQDSQAPKYKLVPRGTEGIVDTVDAVTGKTIRPPANDYDGKASTFRIGMGFIYDFSSYSESNEFKQQMEKAKLNLTPTFKVRDFRILGSGVFKTKRALAFKFAYMYDGDANKWLVRESGFTIGVPELKGNFFVGRTKEGFSMIKVMNGHSPWSYERQMAIDVIPIMADGIKYMGYYPKAKMFLNLGYFNDLTSKGQGFSTFSSQAVARIGWVPVQNKEKNETFHIATSLRYGQPLDRSITLKSRPESNNTPQLINTGAFKADHSWHYAGEMYYSGGRWTLGTEIMTHRFYGDSANHSFSGGNLWAAYSFTGGRRPYVTSGGIFGFVPVKKSVFRGGMGEIEGCVFASVLNLNSGGIKGGKFWRITPMVNWYLSKHLRWELVYGIGQLGRYDLDGTVQFFESRIQVTLM
jgi:phosphate-selective porin OprO/OprP